MKYFFARKESLSEQELQQAKQAVLIDGVATQVMATLTTDTFLISMALALGLNTVYVGILTAIPLLANVFQVAGVYILEKIKNRRKIIVIGLLFGRMFLLWVAFVPLFFHNQMGVIIIIASLVVNACAAAIAGLSWSSWMRDLIPSRELGSFFAKRIFYTTLVGMVINLVAATALDWIIGKYPMYTLQGYSVLFIIGFIAGMIGLLFLARTPEPHMIVARDESILQKFKKPLKDENFIKLLRFTTVWNFAINLALPFFTVYMINRLELSLLTVIILGLIGEGVFMYFVSIWGKYADEYNNRSVLQLTGGLFIVMLFLWTFTTLPDSYFFTLPLLVILHILRGIALSGLNLCSGNIALKLSPKDESPTYLAVHNLVNSLAAGSAPILGGSLYFLVDNFKIQLKIEWSSLMQSGALQTLSFESWDFYFIIAAIIGIYALHRLSLVEEQGEHVSRKHLAKNVARIVRESTLRASLISIRSITSTPFIIYEILQRSKRSKTNSDQT